MPRPGAMCSRNNPWYSRPTAQRAPAARRSTAMRWEAGGPDSIPRMVNQAALDTLLAQADPDVHGRFVGLLAVNDGPALHQLVEPEENQIASGRYTKHPRTGG